MSKINNHKELKDVGFSDSFIQHLKNHEAFIAKNDFTKIDSNNEITINDTFNIDELNNMQIISFNPIVKFSSPVF